MIIITNTISTIIYIILEMSTVILEIKLCTMDRNSPLKPEAFAWDLHKSRALATSQLKHACMDAKGLAPWCFVGNSGMGSGLLKDCYRDTFESSHYWAPTSGLLNSATTLPLNLA